MAKTALQLAQEKAKNLTGEQKNSILDFQAQNKQEVDTRMEKLKDTPTVEPELFGDVPVKPIDNVTPIEPIEPIESPKIETKQPTIIDQGNQQIQKADELKDTAIEELRVNKEKAIQDTKRGFALGKAKFDENKANYKNYDEINTKYNAVIDEITANMGDTGVIDESVYQSIANKYGLPIEKVKNPNRILDGVELTEEGKENLGVNKFEQGIEESTKNFERTREDLNNRITQTEQSYNQQMQDAQESVQDAIQGITASGAASGLFRSTAMTDSMNRTKEQGAKIISRLQSAKERTVGDIQTSLSRITEDFNQSITEAKKEFEKNYIDVNNQNILNISQAGLEFTGDKLQKALKDIEEEFGIKSQAVFQSYMNNLSAINGAVNENMDLVDRIAQQEEEKELKAYNEYLANDGLLLQSTNLDEIVQGVQNGTLTPESAQNLRKIMQTSIQSALGALAPLEMSDIDNINYLLEQGYTPEQAIALMQESFDKFQVQEEEKLTQDWNKLNDGALYNQKTGEVKQVDGSTTSVLTDDANSIATFSTQKRGTQNLQCGMLVNDYILQQTGKNPTGDARFEDTLDDKIKAIETMGESDVPVAGGIFVSNPMNNDVGHTGIVKKVNPDGSIEVLEANAGGSREGEPPTLNTYTAEQVASMVFSQAPKSEITQTDEVQFRLAEGMTGNAKVDFLKEQGLFDKYLQKQEKIAKTKDQYREYVNEYNSTLKLGAGISEKDAELIMAEFNDAVAREDEEGMKTAIFRGVVSKNDENKPVFDAYKTTIQDLNIVQEAYNRYIEKGGKTNIFSGSLEKISQKLGDTTDPDLAQINAGINGILATYIKDTSGTGVSDTERRFISSMLPSIQNIKSLNDVLSQTFIKRIRNGAEQPIRSTVQSDKIYNEVFKPHFMLKDIDGITKTKYDIERGSMKEDPLGIMGETSENDPLGILN